MAGSIHITDEVVWSASTIAFTLVTQLTRDDLATNPDLALKEAYRPIDEECDFLSLSDLGENTYKNFATSCRNAYTRFKDNQERKNNLGELFEGIKTVWLALLELIESDSRFHGGM